MTSEQAISIRAAYEACIAPLEALLVALEADPYSKDYAATDVMMVLAPAKRAKEARERVERLQAELSPSALGGAGR